MYIKSESLDCKETTAINQAQEISAWSKFIHDSRRKNIAIHTKKTKGTLGKDTKIKSKMNY